MNTNVFYQLTTQESATDPRGFKRKARFEEVGPSALHRSQA